MEPRTGTPSERVPDLGRQRRKQGPTKARKQAPPPHVPLEVAGRDPAPAVNGWLNHPLKRVMDLAIAGPGLLLALPAMLLIAAAIRLDSPGPALFLQRRVGRGGRPFLMLKFRTMEQGAEEGPPPGVAGRLEAEATWHEYQKLMRDPRVTRVGRLLRRCSLDELPQLWNVLTGEMTLVGARPILPNQRSTYGPGFEAYGKAPPGLTGLWQVSGRSRLTFRERVEWDERYRESSSFGMDLRILLRTLVAVATRDGAW